MFQTLSNKIITGVITLSMMLLSSYEGNKARFDNVFANFGGNRIFISAELVDAFENDFEEIFRSGELIEIFFQIQIHDQERTIHAEEFRHAVIYDPLEKLYTVYLEEKNLETTAADFLQLIETISQIEYTHKISKYNGGHIILSAYLKKVKLQTVNKEYDLMMLWKFKQPKVKALCNIQEKS